MRKLLILSFFLTLILDAPVRDAITHIEYPYLNEMMGWLSYLGKGWIQAIPCLILMGIGLLRRDTKIGDAGKKGLYAISVAGILTQIIKYTIGRPRPKVLDAVGFSLGPSFARGFDSFPSGHAASSFALASTLAYFYPKLRYPLYIYSVLVSLSRIYINAHFLSDVFAGTILGLWIGWVVTTKGIGYVKSVIREYGPVLGIFALTMFLFFYRLGSPTLFDLDEAVYAESAREMAETGNWITPQYNYSNFYEKPVLFYWLMSSAFKLFGVTEFAARFWSASLGTGLVLISYYFVRYIGNPMWGALSALILATSIEVMVLSHASIMDMTLTFFITSSLFCFFLGYIDQLGYKKWWYRGLYFNMGLAVLTKGPVGIVIPALIIILFLFLRRQIKEVLSEMKIFSGGILFLSVALPWYVIETGINGWEYIDAFFIKHNITRFTGIVSGHSGPVYYFIPVTLLAFFPWSAFLPYGLIRAFKVNVYETRVTKNNEDPRLLKESITLFSAIWFLVVFVLFSISRTKLPGYIAPFSPAIAILVGWVWNEYITSTKKWDRGMRWSMTIFTITGVVMAAGLTLVPIFLEKYRPLFQSPGEHIERIAGIYILSIIIIIGITLTLLAVRWYRKSLAFVAMIGMMTFTIYVLLSYIVPLANIYMQSALNDFAKIAGSNLEKGGGDLIIYGLNRPSIVFYARRPATIIGASEKNRLNETIDSSKKFYLITKGSQTEGLMSSRGQTIHIVAQRGGFALLSNQTPQTSFPTSEPPLVP